MNGTISWKRIIESTLALVAVAAIGVWVGRESKKDTPPAPVVRPNVFVIRQVEPPEAARERETVAGHDEETWESLGLFPEELPELDEPPSVTRSATQTAAHQAASDDQPRIGVNVVDDVGPDAGVPEEEEPPPDAAVPYETGEEETTSSETPAPVGVACGIVTCGPGQVCCNDSCGICTEPGQWCHQRTCGMPYGNSSVSCGSATCNVGDICCNPSCGICVAPGETCDPRQCMNPIQDWGPSESCGMNTCNVGEVCCNPSCGICTKPGEPCSRKVCD